MIYHKIEEIKNKFNFLSSKNFEKYEKFFHKIFKLSFDYKIINFEELKKINISYEIITLDPEIYNNLKNTLNISLFVFSTDKHFSHFFNLAKYIDINKITNKEDLKYKEYYFNNFLWNSKRKDQ